MQAQTIEFQADGSTGNGYLIRPDGDGPFPAVVVIQEWWGLDDHIKDVARRFAAAGFLALAPDLYHGAVATEPDEARKLVMQLQIPQAVAEMVGAVNYLCGRDDVTKIATIGFCMGGSLALVLAAHTPRIAAVASFYGGRQLADADLMAISAPILAVYGGKDQGIGPEMIEHQRDVWQRTGVQHEIVVYPDAQHAFFNDSRPHAHDPQASADAWQRVLRHFHCAMDV